MKLSPEITEWPKFNTTLHLNAIEQRYF